MAATFDSSWWNFNSAPDGLSILNVNGVWDTSPSVQNFTACALIEVPAVGVDATGQSIIGKYNGVNGWDYFSLRCGVGAAKNLTAHAQTGAGTLSDVSIANPIPVNTKALVAISYQDVGGLANNVLRVAYTTDGVTLHSNVINNCIRLNSSLFNNAPFWIGGRTGSLSLGGKMYWAAWFGNDILTPVQLLSFFNQTAHPADITPTCNIFIDFHKTVGATYVAEHSERESTSINTTTPYFEFTVDGAPTKGGVSTTPSFPASPNSNFWECKQRFTVNEGLRIARASDINTENLIPKNQDFTLVCFYRRTVTSSVVTAQLVHIGERFVVGQKCTGLDLTTGSTPEVWTSSDGNAVDTLTGSSPSANRAYLSALRYTYVGAGDVNPSLNSRVTTLSDNVTSENLPGPVFDPGTGPEILIGRNLGYQTLGTDYPGYIYWAAIYLGTAISSADLVELYLGTKHPMDDFSPALYIDFHKSVGATYAAEVGNYTFTVDGTPVLNGVNESTIRTDYPPGLVSATYYAANTIRVVFDSPMENNAALTNAANYGLSGAAAVTNVTRIQYDTVDLTFTGTVVNGDVLTVTTAEDILGTPLPVGSTVVLAGFPTDVGVFVAEILVDETVVWTTGTTQAAQERSVDVSSYTGEHDLTLRIRRIS